MIPNPVRQEILDRLRRAESEHDVKVVLAVESGSRAWGFASPNSDFDARFIYAHSPQWYLSVGLEEKRDVIEYPIVDDLDVNGWDLRKALRLFRKSNPAFLEWIQSPIVYVETEPFAEQARSLTSQVYSCTAGINHYRSMAKANFRGYLREAEVPLKKYLYVLRPLLAVRWIERFRTVPPIVFSELFQVVESKPQLLADIRRLVELKRKSPELGVGPRIDSIHEFVEEELTRLETNASAPTATPAPFELLDELFHQTLALAWPGKHAPP